MDGQTKRLIDERAREKLDEVRPKMEEYDMSTDLEPFLLELFRAVYGLRVSCSHDIHAFLTVDIRENAKTEIWVYYDPQVSDWDSLAEDFIQDFVNGLDAQGLRPLQFEVVCKLRYGTSGEDFNSHSEAIGKAGGLDVVASLGTIPDDHPLNCGWFRSVEGDDGSMDEDLEELYYHD
ncbi:hypothetical protein EKO27_g7804 [Xylaria grammica]|uniref:Uncharacterized protein n=1 Tax=Xylaria grammica TaxID=363999 RepID=A0A439CZ36_9PEZI|nr:hypothetical protein EKO27_g7804 [Xylaria grammica]